MKLFGWLVVLLLLWSQQACANEGLKIENANFCKSTSLDITLRSRHVKQEHQNEDNFGFGLECEVKKNFSFEAGRYRNSSRHNSNHFGAVFDPYKPNKTFSFVSEKISLGTMAAYTSGYISKENCSKNFGLKIDNNCYVLLILPTLRYTEKQWGVNLYATPAAGGVFGLQVRYIFR